MIHQYKAGDFRDPIWVQRVTTTDDGSGGQIKTWANYCTIYVSTDAKGAGEAAGDGFPGRILTRETRNFVTWYRDDITTEDRLIYEGAPWNIRHTDNMSSRNKFLELIAEKGVET